MLLRRRGGAGSRRCFLSQERVEVRVEGGVVGALCKPRRRLRVQQLCRRRCRHDAAPRARTVTLRRAPFQVGLLPTRRGCPPTPRPHAVGRLEVRVGFVCTEPGAWPGHWQNLPELLRAAAFRARVQVCVWMLVRRLGARFTRGGLGGKHWIGLARNRVVRRMLEADERVRFLCRRAAVHHRQLVD
eukprot:378370-Rhodomonas_salina.1